MLRNAMGGIRISADKCYEGAGSNVIGVMRVWVGGCQMSRKKA